jgi:hypothetical protein
MAIFKIAPFSSELIAQRKKLLREHTRYCVPVNIFITTFKYMVGWRNESRWGARISRSHILKNYR